MKSNVFEEKNIAKAVLMVGLPAMLAQLTTLIYNMADTFFVSMTGDSAQISAVALCTPLLLMIMSISVIFGMGGGSVIARLIGEDRLDDAAYSFNYSTYSVLISSAFVMVIGLIFITPIAKLSGADASNLESTCDYLRWILIGSPFIMICNGVVHSFRSLGLIKESTIGIALGNGVNIVFDYIFIIALGMGAKGAAMATSFGFLCATVYYIIVLFLHEKRGNQLIQMSPKHYWISSHLRHNVIKIGIPGALITVMLSVSNIVLNNFIAIYGADAVASYGIAYKIDMFPIMLSVGLAQGAAPLMGFYFGRKNAHELAKTMRYSFIYNLILGAIFALLIFSFRGALAGIFLKPGKMLELTSLFLALLCFHAPLLGIINPVTTYFQALGRAVNSLVITILRNLVLFIPGAIIMNALFKLNGVILTQLVVEGVLSVICILLYLKNRPSAVLAE